MTIVIKRRKEKFINGTLYKLCACGVCGKYFKAGKTTAGTEKKFISGHNTKNSKITYTDPDAHRKNCSIAAIKRWSDLEYRRKHRKSMILTYSNSSRNEKISIANKGERSHSWKGGISQEPYSQEFTERLKKYIRSRDNYRCQICKISHSTARKKYTKGLYVHHIDYDKKNSNPDNLISLCNSCHSKTSVGNRTWWIDFFINLKQKGDVYEQC
jgi:hypothetical protein